MEIHWRNAGDLNEAQQRAAEERIAQLAADHTDLIDVRIAVKATRHHRLGAREVRIVCQARRKELVASRTGTEAGLALNEALDAFEREVRRLRDRRSARRPEWPTSPPLLGIVDRILGEEGYGFILTDGGERVYFHRNAVHGGLEFEHLAEGDRVALGVEEGLKGPQATAVVRAPANASSP